MGRKKSTLSTVLYSSPLNHNHSPPASLKNAIDYLFFEWNNKSAGFVGYGSMGAIRAIEQLRILMGALMIADVRAEVMLSLFEDFEKLTVFKPNPRHEKQSITCLHRSFHGVTR